MGDELLLDAADEGEADECRVEHVLLVGENNGSGDGTWVRAAITRR